MAAAGGLFFLSDEQLQATPSRADGLDDVTEFRLRVYGGDIIQAASLLLRLCVTQTQRCLSRSALTTFFLLLCADLKQWRSLRRCCSSASSASARSHGSTHGCVTGAKRCSARAPSDDASTDLLVSCTSPQRLAAASVFLAAKLEEAQRRARDVINVFHRLECREETALKEGTFSWRLAGRSDPCSLELLDMFGREYDSLKAELVRDERLVLRELGFVCHVEHAHKFVLSYAKLLELSAEVTTAAWEHVNDCGRTTLVCRFRANTLACGAIFLAARTAGVALPEGESHISGGDGGQKPWWILFDAATEDVHAVANVLTCLYAQPTKSFADIMAAAPHAHVDKVQAPEPQGRRQVVVTLPTPNGTAHVTAPQQPLEQPHVQQSGRRSRFDAPVAGYHGDGDRGRRRGGPSRSRSRERGARHNQRRSRSRSRSRDRRRSRSRDRRR